ncbi:GyrI-like domain-containing protein [Aquimarina gracilis]|uniref:GyrI-like domain-containing protein n=1 Tax=Aquimarina gracilis TaxID=874422 RepID=A0ABU5ZXP6_9FLAO|nr:GyrI-like domain-containing protein [Aquimarina gracilis]MEB3346675.1 GyrI-like domain-containing protein [Aquimarina gracilis]
MSKSTTNSYSDRISKAIVFIEENLTNTLTLDNIAQVACYSKYHFLRIFTEITGETVLDYVRKRRVSESANDLLLTQKPIIEIAIHYRFDSQQAYTRAFKSVFEVSPGKYRKKGHRLVSFEKYTLSPNDINRLQTEFTTMIPSIINSKEKKLIGLKDEMSLSHDKTTQMWQEFMPRRHEIKSNKDTGYYSIQVHNKNITLENFTKDVIFEKWAAVEVEDFNEIPKKMFPYTLPEGKYAVFIHKGTVHTFQKTMDHIMGIWLPDSGYKLDTRDIFTVMGEKYHGPFHPKSEEEVWIPII